MTDIMKLKTKKFPVFWICYLVYVLLCIIFWFYVISYVQGCLIQYEAAQPERVIEGLVAKLQNGDVEEVFTIDAPPSRFESSELLIQRLKDELQGKTITFAKEETQYNTATPVYRIYADDGLIGTIALQETSIEPLMFILSIGQWEIADTQPVLAEGAEAVTVCVPDSYSVSVNGIALGKGDMTGEEKIPEQFQYAKEYVEVPKLVEYRVQGLLEKPGVTVRDGDGKSVDFEESYEDGEMSILVDSFPVTEIEEDLAKMALENAKKYSNFFSADLPGSSASTRPIAGMFPKDSYYLQLAETYRREDMWMISKHAAPTFTDEEVMNYIRYSEDFFSCEVFFKKHYYLINTGDTRIDTTHTRFYYAKVDEKWVIVDMQTILDSTEEE